MSGLSMDSGKTVKLAERRIFSQSFKPLYNEGMSLVEQAAEYLDGQGRAEAKKLSRLAATLYAAESMRLTTRLMQVASWLLLQRAANSGEMTRDQVASEKSKVRLDTASANDDSAAGTNCPPISASWSTARSACRRGCAAWTRRSTAPYCKRRLAAKPRKTNPVSDQITLLKTAFAAIFNAQPARFRPAIFCFVHNSLASLDAGDRV